MNDSGLENTAARKLQENIHLKTNSSKRTTYLLMNPLLKAPTIYKNENIPEYKRFYYTRLRLSSHNLKIETGRWTRTPRNRAYVLCREDIQTEQHVLLNCSVTQELREEYMEITK